MQESKVGSSVRVEAVVLAQVLAGLNKVGIYPNSLSGIVNISLNYLSDLFVKRFPELETKSLAEAFERLSEIKGMKNRKSLAALSDALDDLSTAFFTTEKEGIGEKIGSVQINPDCLVDE